MGKTFSTGLLTNGVFQDSSNNIGIGGAANASYKFQVTGATNLTAALTGTSATMNGSGGTTEPITMVFDTGINRLLSPVLRLYGATNVASNYVELFGTLATQNSTVNFHDASGTVALTSNLSSYLPLSGGTLSGALTMGAYSFASSAIQFTRASSDSVTPASGNGILVLAGGNSQVRMDSSNNFNIDMNNAGSPFTVLKLQQNGNTVVVNSPNNSLSLALAYQGTIHGYMGAASSALYAYSNNGGYVYLTSSSTWVAASDLNRKRNFETYNLGLKAILGLKPKIYNMDFQDDGDEKQVGLVAQEVKEHIPQAFEKNEEFIGINYNVIIVTLVNAIQELKAEIDELKNK